MDNQSAGIDFVLIGHQDCWEKITRFAGFLNKSDRNLSAQQMAEVYSYIPPRKLFDIEVNSITGEVVKGVYIETFISPDELGIRSWKKNVVKVHEAVEVARGTGAHIAGLGGFTSIVLEGRDSSLNENSVTQFTTGNSLTAAFIVKSVEKACTRFDKNMKDQKLLIIGATGDIGSACVNYFKHKVESLLICARQIPALEAMETDLKNAGCDVKASVDLATLLPDADIIIAIASSTIANFHASLCKPSVIICDAGYPKNLIGDFSEFSGTLFCGGMGQLQGKFLFNPAVHHQNYDFPVKNAAHGCLLEAIILAFEKRSEPYSFGKGNITIEKIEWIYALAKKHGISEAPFFNTLGPWTDNNLHENKSQWSGAAVESDLHS